jgi:hypothetical protein
MKNIVEEALNGKKTTQQKNDKNTTQSPNQKTSDPNALNQLVRPNHQNKNVEKRLSMLNNQLNQQKTNEKTTQTQTTRFPYHSKSSLEDSISELRKVSFSNGKSEKVAKDTFLPISQRSLASVETLQINSPSAWVLKHLGIKKNVESIGLVEGLSYFNNLLILDQFYKNEQNPDLSIQLEQQYLVITGKTEAITETLSILKKLGDRI